MELPLGLELVWQQSGSGTDLGLELEQDLGLNGTRGGEGWGWSRAGSMVRPPHALWGQALAPPHGTPATPSILLCHPKGEHWSIFIHCECT